MAKNLIAFGWYGGKYSHLSWLLPLLPKSKVFVEPFGGSAAVLINRQPSDVEVYNDLDSEAVNFFSVLRDEPDSLIEKLSLTPVSRESYYEATFAEGDDLERARRFGVRAKQTRMGLARLKQVRLWCYTKGESRCGMGAVNSKWIRSIPNLSKVAQRMSNVITLNQNALDVMKEYDSPDTLFYLDPPYLPDTRSDSNCYGNEMTLSQHEEFGRVVNTLQGKVAISGYGHSVYDDMFAAPKWGKYLAKEKLAYSSRENRQEVLWTNYDTTTGERL